MRNDGAARIRDTRLTSRSLLVTGFDEGCRTTSHAAGTLAGCGRKGGKGRGGGGDGASGGGGEKRTETDDCALRPRRRGTFLE